jgi:large subunit ribosomal protein L15
MNIRAPGGAIKRKKVVGRGPGSGRGCTAGRGSNGQKSRSGYSRQIGFEGGQMPLARRIPKRGFNNKRFENAFQMVNIGDLEKYKDGDKVDYVSLHEKGLINKRVSFIKLLGKGNLTRKLHIIVNKASKRAVEEVEKLGGKVEIIK